MLLAPRFTIIGLLLCAVFSACRGSVPRYGGDPRQGTAALLLAGRMILPSGKTLAGKMAVNLEGEGGRLAEIYRLPVSLSGPLIFQIEPGTYRLSPTRSFFGFHEEALTIDVEGDIYRIPFPRDILRKPAMVFKPGKAYVIGVIEARVPPSRPGENPNLRVHLDDSILSRRRLLEDVIKDMTDPAKPLAEREHAIAWSRALQTALVDVTAETERLPLYKPAP